MLELFVLVQKFDGDMAIGFLQHRCSTLVEGLDLVNDCRVYVLVIYKGVHVDWQEPSGRLTKRSPEHSSSNLNILIRQMPQITPRSDIHVKSQVDDHTERIARIDPSGTRLIAQRKE